MKDHTSKIAVGLAVVGAGPGGYAAAFLAADMGLDVALIDPAPDPGGVCLYRGCIPSKALLHVARLLREAAEAERWGVKFGEPEIDLRRLREWKNEIVGRLTGGLGQLTARRKIRYLRGRASLRDPHSLEIESSEGERSVLSFDHAILATGSRPHRLAGLPDDPSLVVDSTGALELDDVPRRLLVIGGGYIGLELGSVYAALGSRVTVVEMTEGLLPGVDRDLVRPLATRLEELFEAVLTRTEASDVRQSGNGAEVTLKTAGGETTRLQFDRILVAVGRRPNTEGLGLEQTRIEVDEHGFVVVDGQLRTAEESIFAIGDMVGQPMLAHKASHEGRVAVRAIDGQKVAFEPNAIPAVVFTDPEIAWCGMSEEDARSLDRKVTIARFPWAASGRAMTLGRSDGLTKLVIDPATERVLGVGLVGPGAGELIAEGVVAIEMAALVSDLEACIHPHPTLSETIMESAEVFFGHATHVHRPARKSG